MSFLTAWGIDIPIKNDKVRAKIDFAGQTRDTWQGGISGSRKGVRDAWEATICGVTPAEADFWMAVFSGQGTSIPFADTKEDATSTRHMTSGTRGPPLLSGAYSRGFTPFNENTVPGLPALYLVTVDTQLKYDWLFNDDEYTLIYNNGGTYGAHWPGGSLGASASATMSFSVDQLFIDAGEKIGDILWFPVVVPDYLVQLIVDFGNAGNPICGFAKIPMGGRHFNDEIKYQVPIPRLIQKRPVTGLGSLFNIRIGFGDSNL